MFKGIAVEIIGGLGVLVLAGLSYRFRARFLGLIARERTSARGAKRDSTDDELRVLRSQVIQVAKARAINVPERSKGNDPVGVAFTNGQTTWFFRDLESRKRAAERNPAVGMNSTHLASPPVPVSRWTAATCREWLEKHAD